MSLDKNEEFSDLIYYTSLVENLYRWRHRDHLKQSKNPAQDEDKTRGRRESRTRLDMTNGEQRHEGKREHKNTGM